LVSGRTYTLAYVIHQSPELTAADLFMPEVLQGLFSIARDNDYQILFRSVDPDDPDDSYAQLIYQGYVDGIILSGPQLEEPEAVELTEQGLPIVLTGRLPGYDVPFVDADNYRGAQLATQHLIDQGHQRIGHITNGPLTYVASRERLRGYQDCLLASELIYDQRLVIEGRFTPESGAKAMGTLLRLEERPSAVFVASDVVAFGALKAVKQAGLEVPADLALIGFDGVAFGRYVEPPLTTIKLPAMELGRQAGRLLLQLVMRKSPNSTRQLLDVELVVRASTARDRNV
jgi:DNA-binding LacI/PurR family transcriptional regulator